MMFHDVFQTIMEVELGLEWCQRTERLKDVSNYRNGHWEAVHPFIFKDALHYKVKEVLRYYNQGGLCCSVDHPGWAEALKSEFIILAPIF